VATRVLGPQGAGLIAAGVALSSLGFLSQSILTAPRVYFAMAEDGVFLRGVARVHPRRAPRWSPSRSREGCDPPGAHGHFRGAGQLRRGHRFHLLRPDRRLPVRAAAARRAGGDAGHPVTTLLFIGVCATVSVSSFVQDPVHGLIGLALTVAGFPVYLLWRRTR